MSIEFDPTTIIVIAACLAVFVVQLLLCLFAKKVIVRLIPTLLTLLCAGLCFGMMFLSSGWDVIGYLLLAIIACFPAGTSILAWIVFGIVCLFRKKKK